MALGTQITKAAQATPKMGLELELRVTVIKNNHYHYRLWVKGSFKDPQAVTHLIATKIARGIPMGFQWVKDLVLSLQWLRSLLWHRFDPWPGNFHMLWVWQKKKIAKNCMSPFC